MENYTKKQLALPTLSLFTSIGTLLCCALPALFVSLGAGAVLAGLVSNYPQIAIISKYKIYIFSVAGFLIIISGLLLYKARNMPCSADAQKAKACKRLRKFSVIIYIFSAVVFIIGFFFAFIAQYLLV
jgi:F0F1-type ATP synthase membrane subunit c/vacuolar-type H+-ATPase subunit K